MKAAVLYANDDLRYEEIPTPEINDDEVLIEVKMSGICGSDVPRVLCNGAHFYPIVLGHEFSGVVKKFGKNVNGLSKGDKVAGIPLIPCGKCKDCIKGNYSLCKNYTFVGSRKQGSFAEYVKLPKENVIKFDKSLSFEQGALFEPSTVALHGIKCAKFTGGKDVAIVGGGTIGLFAMQFAKIMGAKSVTVFDINDSRLELAEDLGADHCINSKKEKAEMKYDFVFDVAGNENTIKTSLDIAENKATVCLIGTPHSEIRFSKSEWETINRKEMFLTGSWMSYSAPFPGDEWILTEHYFRTGQLKYDERIIFEEIPLKDCKKAFDLYKTPGAVQGKIMLYNG